MTTKLTKSEAIRRFRIVAAECRRLSNVGSRAPIEIGLRELPQRSFVPPLSRDEAIALCFPDGDDVASHCSLEEYARDAHDGDVLHLYVHDSMGMNGELKQVIVVWLGTDAYEPRIIDPAFRQFYGHEGEK